MTASMDDERRETYKRLVADLLRLPIRDMSIDVQMLVLADVLGVLANEFLTERRVPSGRQSSPSENALRIIRTSTRKEP